MTRPALTSEDWQAITRAATVEDVDLRQVIEDRVRGRLRNAWTQGFRAGFECGQLDAIDDDVPSPAPPNPYDRSTT